MGTVAEKLTYLQATKSAIKSAIEAKGVAVDDKDSFRSYAARIGEIAGDGAYDTTDPEAVYRATRPADWLPMPQAADDEIYMLQHIPDTDQCLTAFKLTCTGSYTVELGTMVSGAFVPNADLTQTIASGTQCDLTLAYADWGDQTVAGERQCMIKISGTDLLSFAFAAHANRGSNVCTTQIVDIAMRVPAMTAMLIGGAAASASQRNLQYFRCTKNAIANASNLFRECNTLQAVMQMELGTATNASYLFSNCYSLQAVAQMDTSAIITTSYMFSNCYSLQALPALDTRAMRSAGYTFRGCASLKSLSLLNTANAATLASFFSGCSALTECALDISNLGNSPALIAGMLDGCYSLERVSITANADVTIAGGVNLLNAALSYAAILTLLDGLPTLTTAQTLTLTGNPGASQLTEEDIAAAAQKNWTVTV